MSNIWEPWSAVVIAIMSDFDVSVQTFLMSWILPIPLCIILFKISKPILSHMYYKGYAVVMNRITNKMNKSLGKRKRSLFSSISPDAIVAEIGVGSGSNFEYYPENVDVICVDPNAYFSTYLKSNRLKNKNINVQDLIVGKAEDLSMIADNSVDFVVCTLVLCSVEDASKSLQEFRRILRPVSSLQ